MNIRALNEPETSNSSSCESSEDDNRQQSLSKEALQEQWFEKYQKALVAIRDLREDEAKEILQELDSELEKVDSAGNTGTLAQLRFSVLKNLGNLIYDDVDNYLKALNIDASDISLWIKTGDRSMRLDNFAFARLCYEQALSINPENWVAIDRLMEVYYILHLPCELNDLCSKALSMNKHHKKALELLDESRRYLPLLDAPEPAFCSIAAGSHIKQLDIIKEKRRIRVQSELQYEQSRLSISFDTSQAQTLLSFGNYIMKIYGRFAKYCITRNTAIDIAFDNSSINSQSDSISMDLCEKRRSSRNRSDRGFDIKFDELNELFPTCLRIGAIEQAIQRRLEAEKEELVLVETNLKPIREELIIKEIIESLAYKQDLKLCDLFFLYLSKLSSKKQNTLPEVYPKIYNIYRKLCPLPNSVYIEIGLDGISIEELWFTLTANEIAYSKQECMFLLRLLEQLQFHLDDAQHKEFLVRLCLVLGLNSDYRYLEIALERMEEVTRVCASNRKIITRAHLKTLIDRTTEKIMHDNDDPDDSLELINKLAPKSENEMSNREINSLCAAIKSAGVWQRGLDILNQRNDLNLDVIIDTLNVCLQNGAKMDAILASKLCKEAVSGSRPTTWTCLYYGWRGVLSEDELYEEDMIERMDKFFELGHQTLGKKSTCTSDKGEFLMLYVKNLLMDERDTFEERELLNALSCLFGYPSKKPTAVVGHKVQRAPMLWQYADTIYNYFVPESVPTYMCSLRKRGLSSELEPLFKELAMSVPDDMNPMKEGRVSNSVMNFIEKGEPIVTPPLKKNDVSENIFYFLADYYFKNKYFDKAKTYYYYDLAINPKRFDSWAASGLILASEVDKELSEGNIKTDEFTDGPFRNLADSAIRCFNQATLLKPNEPKATLWIEYGNLTYNLVSLASRLFCYDDFELEMQGKHPADASKLEARHKYLYKIAKNCFKSAISLCQSEEVWLQYYMLGKIYEKVDSMKALGYYYKADAQLFIEGAMYPKKILYHNPPNLAFEAMEVHYRTHSCALKYLLTTNEISQANMNLLKKFLLNAQRSPFVQMEGSTSPKNHMRQAVNKDLNLLIEDLVDSVSQEADFDELIFMCLHGMKRCLTRSDKNFKALYRLAYYYRKIRDPRMAQAIFWGFELETDRRIANLIARKPGIPEFQAAPPDLKGHGSLFSDRKNGNVFYNVWRIPVEEIDRPGCFEHWMFKCCWLLVKICVDLRDTNILEQLAVQLSFRPEVSKKYLHDRPRVLMGLYATKAIAKIIFEAVERAEDIEHKHALIKEGITIADRFIKADVFTETMQIVYNQLSIYSNADRQHKKH